MMESRDKSVIWVQCAKMAASINVLQELTRILRCKVAVTYAPLVTIVQTLVHKHLCHAQRKSIVLRELLFRRHVQMAHTLLMANI